MARRKWLADLRASIDIKPGPLLHRKISVQALKFSTGFIHNRVERFKCISLEAIVDVNERFGAVSALTSLLD